jgi:uncharacterized protein YbaP (TraB family)
MIAYVRTAVTLLIALLVPSIVLAQLEVSTCPPPPAEPTTETIQALAKTAKDRGFLWRFEKDGRTGYLYGSIHLGKQEWVFPGPKTIAALQASGVIALELDILDPQIQLQLSDPTRFGIKSIQLPPPLKQRMETLATRVCAPVAALAGLHPLMQLITVTILDARFSNLEVGYSTEIMLSGFARGAKKAIASLETAELQMRALLAGDAKDILEVVESGMTLFESGKQRVQTDRLVNAWGAGNLDELQRYEQWCECMNTEVDRKYMKGLLDDRNPHLAAGIDKLFRDGKNVFAAFGSLHMIGPKSVPKLLEKMGYKVDRVIFEEL